MTKALFNAWFNLFLVPFVAKKNIKNCFENKALLVLDNAQGQNKAIAGKIPLVKVVFIPPNTTSLLQSLNQGIFSLFKSYYIRKVITKIDDATQKDIVFSSY